MSENNAEDSKMVENIKKVLSSVVSPEQAAEAFKLVSEVMNFKDERLKISSWDSINEITGGFRELRQFVARAVALVEAASDGVEGLKNKEKKKAAVRLVDEMIKLPWLLERFDHIPIGFAIDWLVDEFNEKIGKDWRTKLVQVRDYVEVKTKK